MGMKPRVQVQDAGRRFVENMYTHHATGAATPTGRGFHLWGQFIEDLPEKFRPYVPGHQYIHCTDLDHAATLTQELQQFIVSTWPGAKEWAGTGWYRWMLPDGRQATLKFENKKPKSLAHLRLR